ncbi:endosomal/lysosomal proton channel TMEM175-like [Oculina patagonica]
MTEELQLDLFHLKRLQCFNDAVFAIVATVLDSFLVLPIRKLEEGAEISSLAEQLSDKWPRLIIYLIGFLVICAVWESHVLRFRILSRVDDVLVWFNLASLLFTSFLPFTCALEGTFTEKYLSMMLLCGNLLVLEILEVMMIVYAFHQPHLLDPEFENLSKQEIKQRMKLMLVKKAVNPILYILAGALSLAKIQLALFVVAIVVISPCINRLVGVIYGKWKRVHLTGSQFDRMFGNFIDKERVEFFSDGLFAIVSTLLILDITAENFPTKAEVDHNGIEKALLYMEPEMFTYGATFVVVALLWFTHHSLFHYIEKLNQVMLVCNNISLAFVGLSPLINVTLNRYAGHGKPDSRLAVQLGAIIVFMASITQGIVFIIALCKGPNYLESRADPRVSSRANSYLALKLAIFPLMTFLMYIAATLSPGPSQSDAVYHIAAGFTPVVTMIFILMKLVFSCCRDRCRCRQQARKIFILMRLVFFCCWDRCRCRQQAPSSHEFEPVVDAIV